VTNKINKRFFLHVALCLYAILVLFPNRIFSQQSNVPLNQEWIQQAEARMVKAGGFYLSPALMQYEADSLLKSTFTVAPGDTAKQHLIAKGELVACYPVHSSMRPWIENGHPLRKNVLLQNSYNEKRLLHMDNRFPEEIRDYHYRNSLLQLERQPTNGEPLFRLYIDPLLNLQLMDVTSNGTGNSTSGKHYVNTRGVTAHGDIGTKISFETSFWENQAFFPKYISDFAKSSFVIPGQGRWKAFKGSGYDYAMSSGYISYSPCRFFNVQVGSGKFFVGDGYRSLLLSDNSFDYPFARFTGLFGRNNMFQYTTIYASLMNLVSDSPIPPGTERLFQKKAAQFQQLSVNVGRTAEISLFEGLIWTAADNRNKQCLTLAYANPVMFTSLPAFGLNDRNNFLLGATFHIDLLKTIRCYGQLVADEFGKTGTIANKTGFQLGVKYYNAFNVKHFHLQLEYNRVNPYTYSASDSAQAYSHYNQPLAHPLGANFSEIVGSLQYKIGDFFLQTRFSFALLGADTAGRDFGQNIFTSDMNAYFNPVSGGNKVGQGQKTNIVYFDASVGYMLNYASNLNVCLGITQRKMDEGANLDRTSFVYVALRTSLSNNYYDFFRK